MTDRNEEVTFYPSHGRVVADSPTRQSRCLLDASLAGVLLAGIVRYRAWEEAGAVFYPYHTVENGRYLLLSDNGQPEVHVPYVFEHGTIVNKSWFLLADRPSKKYKEYTPVLDQILQDSGLSDTEEIGGIRPELWSRIDADDITNTDWYPDTVIHRSAEYILRAPEPGFVSFERVGSEEPVMLFRGDTMEFTQPRLPGFAIPNKRYVSTGDLLTSPKDSMLSAIPAELIHQLLAASGRRLDTVPPLLRVAKSYCLNCQRLSPPLFRSPDQRCRNCGGATRPVIRAKAVVDSIISVNPSARNCVRVPFGVWTPRCLSLVVRKMATEGRLGVSAMVDRKEVKAGGSSEGK